MMVMMRLYPSVENITGTKIDHVVQIGFDGIAHVVDAFRWRGFMLRQYC